MVQSYAKAPGAHLKYFIGGGGGGGELTRGATKNFFLVLKFLEKKKCKK
jgi:hypothetical protein